MFDVIACIDAASRGRLDDWVDAYLSVGDWPMPVCEKVYGSSDAIGSAPFHFH